LLYEVISRRYKKRSLVLTTNLAFSDWPTVFPNASCAVAMIDRLIESSSIIAIQGDSYRKRVAEQRIKSRSRKIKQAA
jgi:DNA replication protein DnaC